MGTSDVISAGSGLLSLVAIVVSVLVARSQSQLARREQLLPVVSEILREAVAPEFRANRNFIVDQLAVDHPQHFDGMRGLPPDASNRARHVMSYMNNVGLLVANESISAQLVSSVMGGSVVNVWAAVAPYVYAERVLRGDDPNYYGYLEHLAVTVHEIGPDKLATELKLRKWPPETAAR
ncbi:MAG: hypothetical protein ABI140_08170 [Jatrophihabitantaceae bacterium]